MAGILDVADKAEPKSGLLAALAQTWPARAVQGILSAVTLPGDVYQGNVSMYGADGHTNPTVIERAADLGGLLTLGAGAVPAEANSMRAGMRLPSSSSLATPPAPTAEDMLRASSIQNVPLSQARGTQPKMQWDKFNAGDHPPPMIKGYEDAPIAVRREDGEYLIFDGHHRTLKAMDGGATEMPMHVISAKDYAPEFAGRKPAPSISDDDLLKMLLGE